MCRCTTSGEERAALVKAVAMEGVVMVVATAAAMVGEKVAVEKAVDLEVGATVGTWAAGRSQYNLSHSRTEPRLHTVR